MALQGWLSLRALGPPDLLNTEADANLRVSIRGIILSVSGVPSMDVQLPWQKDELYWSKRNSVLTVEDKTITLVIYIQAASGSGVHCCNLFASQCFCSCTKMGVMRGLSAWLDWVGCQGDTQHGHCFLPRVCTALSTSRSWLSSTLVFNRVMKTTEDSGFQSAPFIITLSCSHIWNAENILLSCTLLKGYIKPYIC